jgi:apolipoprotein N-acyltransferase
MFPEIVGARVRAGAAYVVNPSNDTWLTAKFSAQLLDMVALRAVEQRRYLVRVSTSGPSAIFDPLGRATVVTEPFTQGAVTGWVRGATTRTVYGRVGDAFAGVCSTVALAAWGLRARRRGARASEEPLRA